MVKMKTNFVGDRSEFSYTFPTQTNLSFFCRSFCHKTKTLFNTSEFRRKCVAIFVRRKCVRNFGRNNSSFLVVLCFPQVEHINEKQPISDLDSDGNWEEKLPVDYEDIMKRSKNSLQWTAKEEAYSIIRKGFLMSDDKMNSGIVSPSCFCHM
ncbi:hypothetical protein Hanom_Chr04g00317191 [Helianthus anomalus]